MSTELTQNPLQNMLESNVSVILLSSYKNPSASANHSKKDSPYP